MIQSMTGYGKAEATFEGKKIHVEVKSLNSKSLDLSTRISPLYREKEIEVRQMIAMRSSVERLTSRFGWKRMKLPPQVRSRQMLWPTM